MANMPAFQASDESSILSARTKIITNPCDWFLFCYESEIELSSERAKRVDESSTARSDKRGIPLSSLYVTKMYPDSLSVSTNLKTMSKDVVFKLITLAKNLHIIHNYKSPASLAGKRHTVPRQERSPCSQSRTLMERASSV